MRTIIQRVSYASVTINGNGVKTSSIEDGLLVLLGIEDADNQMDIEWLAKKVANLRIFNDDNGVMNRSVIDIDGDILVISQFTLFARTKKGNRPSYIRASKPEIAIPLYESFCRELENNIGKSVKTGVFGADMKVELLNDGPVTIFIDSKE
jgi:D-tyrosyl-tRNA(Tyr) deacylase